MATVRFSREEIDQVKEITAEDTVTVIRYLQVRSRKLKLPRRSCPTDESFFRHSTTMAISKELLAQLSTT